MKFFGYDKVNTADLLTLGEVTIQASSKELRDLASFIAKCADDMEKDLDWEHEHFLDVVPDASCDVDLIIFRE